MIIFILQMVRLRPRKVKRCIQGTVVVGLDSDSSLVVVDWSPQLLWEMVSWEKTLGFHAFSLVLPLTSALFITPPSAPGLEHHHWIC